MRRRAGYASSKRRGITLALKFTMLFNFAQTGFSESWYYNGSPPGGSLPLLSGDFKALADARTLMSAKYVDIVGCRLSDTENPRMTMTQFLFSKFQGSAAPDVASNAWMALVRGVALRGRRQLWLRGIPDDQIEWDAGAQRWLPQGSIASALTNYQNVLKAGPWRMRVVQSAKAAGAANKAINAIAPTAAGGGVELTGPAGVDPDTAQIVSGFKKPLGFLNGTYLPRTGFTLSGGKVVLLNRALSAFQALGYVGGGAIRPQSFEYIAIDKVELEFPRERKTGRPFFGPRGRRSAKR